MFPRRGEGEFDFLSACGWFSYIVWGVAFIISPKPCKSDEAGIMISLLQDQEKFHNLLKAHIVSLRDLGFRSSSCPQTHAGDPVPSL